MGRDIDAVCARYERKLRAGRTQARRDGDVEGQVDAFRKAQESDRALRAEVGQVMSCAGVPSIQWLFYYDFARRVRRMMLRDLATDVVSNEARMQLEVWVARGLAREVLVQVASECFGLLLTGPIPTLAHSAERT
jgi:hypothetical protein